jgi:hypothetical protein
LSVSKESPALQSSSAKASGNEYSVLPSETYKNHEVYHDAEDEIGMNGYGSQIDLFGKGKMVDDNSSKCPYETPAMPLSLYAKSIQIHQIEDAPARQEMNPVQYFEKSLRYPCVGRSRGLQLVLAKTSLRMMERWFKRRFVKRCCCVCSTSIGRWQRVRRLQQMGCFAVWQIVLLTPFVAWCGSASFLHRNSWLEQGLTHNRASHPEVW